MRKILPLILLILLILSLGLVLQGKKIVLDEPKEESKETSPSEPTEEPKIIILHNSTIIKKYDEFFYAPPASAWTEYYIVLEETKKDFWGRTIYVKKRVPYSVYKIVQIGDRYIEWKYEGWFKRHHHEIWRNGSLIIEW